MGVGLTLAVVCSRQFRIAGFRCMEAFVSFLEEAFSLPAFISLASFGVFCHRWISIAITFWFWLFISNVITFWLVTSTAGLPRLSSLFMVSTMTTSSFASVWGTHNASTLLFALISQQLLMSTYQFQRSQL